MTTDMDAIAKTAWASTLPTNKSSELMDVVARNLRDPDRRSNPVPIAKDVKLVASALTVMMAATGCAVCDHHCKAINKIMGMMNASKICSPLRMSS
jgi:hypothetical protein